MPLAPTNAERRRLERFVRAGAGFVRPEDTVATPAALFAAPVTAQQLAEPVTLYFETIFGGSGTVYPAISPWLQTGAATRLNCLSTAGGQIGCVLPDDSTILSVLLDDLPVPVAPFGRLSMAIYVEPVAGDSALFINGDLVAEEPYTPNGVWGTTTGWNYLTSPPTDADGFDFKPVEIFPGFKPAIL